MKKTFWALALLVMVGCSPVRVDHRVSFLGYDEGGYVLRILNNSSESLHDVAVYGVSKRGNKSKKYRIGRLGPRQQMDIGWMEMDGWKWVKGETAVIEVDGYLDKHYDLD